MKFLIRVLVLVFLMQAATGLSPMADKAYAADMWSKLGRGIGNVLTGTLEIFHQPVVMGQNGERWPIAIAGGLMKGIVYAVTRTVVGVYEIATFPIPIPGGYVPIMEPEFIIPES